MSTSSTVPAESTPLTPPDRHSVATQHDAVTYAQWFYTQLRPLAAPTQLPQVSVRLSSKKKKRNHSSSVALGRSPRSTNGTEDDVAEELVVSVDANNFTPDRSGLTRSRPQSHSDLDVGDAPTLLLPGDDPVVSPQDKERPVAASESDDPNTAHSSATTTSSPSTSSTSSTSSVDGDREPEETLTHTQENEETREATLGVKTPSPIVCAVTVPAPVAMDDATEGHMSTVAPEVATAQAPPEVLGDHRQQHQAKTSSLVCSSSFALELETFIFRRLQLRQEEIRDRHRFVQLVERVVQNVLGKRAQVTIHGSLATGLALQSSDIDVLVSGYEPIQPLMAIERVSNALYALDSYEIPDLSLLVASPLLPTTTASSLNNNAPQQGAEQGVHDGGRSNSTTPTTATPTSGYPSTRGGIFDQEHSMVRQGQLLAVQTIVATRVPVVKVTEKITGHRCDVSFGGGEHFPSMNLTRKLLEEYRSARSLLLWMKFCVKKMQIGESEPGGITSFPLYLLALHFYHVGLPLVARHRDMPKVATPPTSAQRAPVATLPLASDQCVVEAALHQAFPESTTATTDGEPVATKIASYLFQHDQATGVDQATAATTSRANSEDAIPLPPLDESKMSLGQIVLDFCLYYAYLFDYENTGIHFNLDGTSTVVDKPVGCRFRGQHLHMSSPFDERYDLTARMSHTREFQMMCHGLVSIFDFGSLANVLAWISPDTMSADLHDVYHALHMHMHHHGTHHGYRRTQRHQQGLGVPPHPPHNGHPNQAIQVMVGANRTQQSPHMQSMTSLNETQSHGATLQSGSDVSRSPQLGVAFPQTVFPHNAAPTSVTGGPLPGVPPGYNAMDLSGAVVSPSAVTTGTMTMIPQAPPMVPPPISIGPFAGTRTDASVYAAPQGQPYTILPSGYAAYVVTPPGVVPPQNYPPQHARRGSQTSSYVATNSTSYNHQMPIAPNNRDQSPSLAVSNSEYGTQPSFAAGAAANTSPQVPVGPQYVVSSNPVVAAPPTVIQPPAKRAHNNSRPRHAQQTQPPQGASQDATTTSTVPLAKSKPRNAKSNVSSRSGSATPNLASQQHPPRQQKAAHRDVVEVSVDASQEQNNAPSAEQQQQSTSSAPPPARYVPPFKKKQLQEEQQRSQHQESP